MANTHWLKWKDVHRIITRGAEIACTQDALEYIPLTFNAAKNIYEKWQSLCQPGILQLPSGDDAVPTTAVPRDKSPPEYREVKPEIENEPEAITCEDVYKLCKTIFSDTATIKAWLSDFMTQKFYDDNDLQNLIKEKADELLFKIDMPVYLDRLFGVDLFDIKQDLRTFITKFEETATEITGLKISLDNVSVTINDFRQTTYNNFYTISEQIFSGGDSGGGGAGIQF